MTTRRAAPADQDEPVFSGGDVPSLGCSAHSDLRIQDQQLKRGGGRLEARRQSRFVGPENRGQSALTSLREVKSLSPADSTAPVAALFPKKSETTFMKRQH